MTVLVLVELDGGEPADASLRAVSMARSLGDVGAVVFADAAPADALAHYGVTDVYLIESSALDGYAPQAWARTLAGLASETGATAVSNQSHAGVGWLLGAGLTYDFSGGVFTKLGWDHYASVGDASTGQSAIDMYSLGVGMRF